MEVIITLAFIGIAISTVISEWLGQ